MLRVVDADVFIAAKDGYYPFEGYPGFWDYMSHAFHAGKLISTKMVYDEILTGDPEGPLVSWVKPLEKYFLLPDKAVNVAHSKIVAYVQSEYNNDEKIERFFAGADPWLIATAMAQQETIIIKQVTVVTNEKRNNDVTSHSEVKIPNICEALEVECEWNIYPFMAQEKVRLVLEDGGK